MTREADWLSYRQALDAVLAHAHPLSTELLPPVEGLGRALASPLVSPLTLPAADNSAMDGYAVRWEEVTPATPEHPVALKVVGDLRAGDTTQIHHLEPGQALRIATGSPVPSGATGVVRVEDTRSEGDGVLILTAQEKPANIRPRGEDLQEGQKVLPAGTEVNPGVVSLASAMGLERILVHTQPTVAILSTGSELVGPESLDRVRTGSAVLDSNGPGLAAAAHQAGGRVLRRRRVEDSLPHLEEAIRQQKDARVLILTGGASVGPADLVKPALEALGMKRVFWRIRMRPGSPVYFGTLGDQSVFGLPGNPTSAHVTFEMLVRPFLRTVAGHGNPFRLNVRMPAGAPLKGGKGLDHFIRVVFRSHENSSQAGGGLAAYPAGLQGSGLLLPMARAQGLAHIPPNIESVAPGQEVEVFLLDPSGALAPGGHPLRQGKTPP
ncbi:MAG: gephyrin-like molybdotransferase Glp [Gemmatimonadota bacterium]